MSVLMQAAMEQLHTLENFLAHISSFILLMMLEDR